jgi:multiple sugar transport system permease protein
MTTSIPLEGQPVVSPRGLGWSARRRRDGWLMVAPAVPPDPGPRRLPVISSLVLSFRRWDLQSHETPFIGIANYAEAVADARHWGSWANTLAIVVSAVSLELLLGFGLALLLLGDFRASDCCSPC